MSEQEPLSLEDHIVLLEAFRDREDGYKDFVHEKLNRDCRLEPFMGCWIYQGPGCERSGGARIRVGAAVCRLGRVAAWLYKEGFQIWNNEVVVVHACGCKRCFNPDHLELISGKLEAKAFVNRLMGRIRQYGREKTWRYYLQRKADGLPGLPPSKRGRY